MAKIALVVHNVRSALNVGSILRTAEGLGVDFVYLTGYTPYPEHKSDIRLPHQRQKQALQIHKTALGAEYYVKWQQNKDIQKLLKELRGDGWKIAALEQTSESIALSKIKTEDNLALMVGNEVSGLEKKVLEKADICIQIPMRGRKESFNVAIAAAIALYHFKYIS